MPSIHLNSILVNINESDKPNAPRYIRHKRRKSCYIQKESDLISSSASNSDLSSDNDEKQLKKPLLEPKKKYTTRSQGPCLTTGQETATKIEKSITQCTKPTDSHDMIDKAANVNMEIISVESKIPTFKAHIPSLGGSFFFINLMVKKLW